MGVPTVARTHDNFIRNVWSEKPNAAVSVISVKTESAYTAEEDPTASTFVESAETESDSTGEEPAKTNVLYHVIGLEINLHQRLGHLS